MNGLRVLQGALLIAALAACSPAPKDAGDAEIAAMAPLRQRYPDLVAGFEIRPATTLIVSLDLQNYIEADDSEIAAMKRSALERWRTVWAGAHPHRHAVLEIRFIDFIGRKVASETTKI